MKSVVHKTFLLVSAVSSALIVAAYLVFWGYPALPLSLGFHIPYVLFLSAMTVLVFATIQSVLLMIDASREAAKDRSTKKSILETPVKKSTFETLVKRSDDDLNTNQFRVYNTEMKKELRNMIDRVETPIPNRTNEFRKTFQTATYDEINDYLRDRDIKDSLLNSKDFHLFENEVELFFGESERPRRDPIFLLLMQIQWPITFTDVRCLLERITRKKDHCAFDDAYYKHVKPLFDVGSDLWNRLSISSDLLLQIEELEDKEDKDKKSLLKYQSRYYLERFIKMKSDPLLEVELELLIASQDPAQPIFLWLKCQTLDQKKRFKDRVSFCGGSGVFDCLLRQLKPEGKCAHDWQKESENMVHYTLDHAFLSILFTQIGCRYDISELNNMSIFEWIHSLVENNVYDMGDVIEYYQILGMQFFDLCQKNHQSSPHDREEGGQTNTQLSHWINSIKPKRYVSCDSPIVDRFLHKSAFQPAKNNVSTVSTQTEENSHQLQI